MISQSSFAASAGGGSAAGAAGFDFEDIELEGNLHKFVKIVQKNLVREIDNRAVLEAYGIVIGNPVSVVRPIEPDTPALAHSVQSMGGPGRINATQGSQDFRASVADEDNTQP